jgi:CBS domain containing-hemolysin-like protein
MCFFCIGCAGLAAGLTIGLVSIDQKELKLKLINGTNEEQEQARKILPLIKDHHWLLVTLFLFNATANEALPVFLTSLVPEWLAIVLSTFSVLIFGEIIPSSVFSGPSQLKIASKCAWIVKGLLVIFYVVARPIGLFLDWWLGKHESDGIMFNARDLFTLLSLSRDPTLFEHNEDLKNPLLHNSFLGEDAENRSSLVHNAPAILRTNTETNFLNADAITIAQGAITSSKKTVMDLTQRSFHYISSDVKITLDWFEHIGKLGYSRFLIKDVEAESLDYLEYFVVKELFCDIKSILQNDVYVRDLPKHRVAYFDPECRVLDALNSLQRGISRIGVVTEDGRPTGRIMGYFSMEDVVEEIIQEEIQDEKDSRATGNHPRLSITRDHP